MAKRVAKFEKVSYQQFQQAIIDSFWAVSEEDGRAREIYNCVSLPARATTGSAGYDFISPVSFTLSAGQTVKIPTGIRVKMNDGWVLKIYPRSGLGFKYRTQLDNTVGIIDSDYYYSDNEGHIMLKITNDSKEAKLLKVKAGDAIAQGIFVEYGITEDDNVQAERNGGFGSTDQ